MKYTKLLSLAAFASFGLAASSAQAATTLYYDDFGGDGLSDLNGTTPDTTIGTNIWEASTRWDNDGSVDPNAQKPEDNAFLAFNPVAGNIYTLSASLAIPLNAEGKNWAAIGFTEDNTLDNAFWENNGGPWVIYRETTQVMSDKGPGIAGLVDEGNHTGPISLSIVLDTTNATDWTAQWSVDGNIVRVAESIGTRTIKYVGLGRSNGVEADFSSFELTSIPEPSSYALLAGCFGLTWVMLRRR